MTPALELITGAPVTGGWRVRSPSRSLLTLATLLLVALTGLGLAGLDLGTSGPTAIACVAILLFGLPHGALDMRDLQGHRSVSLLASYLGTGGAMALAWWAQPLFALLLFYTIAAVHFAEDWSSDLEPFFGHATALAVLSAPAMLHLDELRRLFALLAPGGEVLAEALLMVAPVSLLVAGISAAANWRTHRRRVVEALVGTAAMLVLPPVIGFALFFTLIHSPRHLREMMPATGRVGWGTITVLTGLALLLAAALYAIVPHATPAEGVYRSCFTILSILTLPHLLLPFLKRCIGSV